MKIAQAAIIHDGVVWTGKRHSQIIRDIVENLGRSAAPVNGPQGFVTDGGEFVDRAEAALIAFSAGQIKRPMKTLFSEDLL